MNTFGQSCSCPQKYGASRSLAQQARSEVANFKNPTDEEKTSSDNVLKSSNTSLCCYQENKAGVFVASTIMLHAWRRRRAEVQQLQQSMKHLETNYMKTKNQLHVSTTLMRVEQKRNRDLQLQLRDYSLSLHEKSSSCDNLSSSVLSLSSEKKLLEQQLSNKKLECENLCKYIDRNKCKLYRALNKQYSYEKELHVLQRTQQDNIHLNNEIVKLRNHCEEFKKIVRMYCQDMTKKDDLLHHMTIKIDSIQQQLQERSVNSKELDELRQKEVSLTSKISELEEQLEAMQQSRFSAEKLKQEFLAVFTKDRAKQIALQGITRYPHILMYLFSLYLLPPMSLSLVIKFQRAIFKSTKKSN